MQLRPVRAVFNGAICDTEPLADLIETYTPDTFLEQVAARHAVGGGCLS